MSVMVRTVIENNIKEMIPEYFTYIDKRGHRKETLPITIRKLKSIISSAIKNDNESKLLLAAFQIYATARKL